MEATYTGNIDPRKLRMVLPRLPLAKTDVELLRQDAMHYEQTPIYLSIHGLTFSFFIRICKFQRSRELISLGLLSDGTIHCYKCHFGAGGLPPGPPSPVDYVQIENLWSREYQTFVHSAFLQQIFRAQLPPHQIAIMMEHYRGAEANIQTILRDYLQTCLIKALYLFLNETDPQRFDPEDPSCPFNQVSLYQLLNEYYYLPLRRSRELRDEVAAKFAFTYDPVRAAFFKRNAAHELVVDSSGNISLDNHPVCITFKKPTTLPTDDVVACKFFALADPVLRRQIATLAPYQSLLEELFHEPRENCNREIPERERS